MAKINASIKYGEAAKALYKSLTQNSVKAPMKLVPKKIEPDDFNYENGFFTRYFARQANDLKAEIIEIDLKTYSKLSSAQDGFYKTLKIDWKISGNLRTETIDGVLYKGVLVVNEEILNQAETELPGIKELFGNLVKYYK